MLGVLGGYGASFIWRTVLPSIHPMSFLCRVGLPFTLGNVKIQAVSGYVIVRQQFVFSMAWDGNSSVYLKMSPDYFGRTHGLCGNNNWSPHDDLMTSYGETSNLQT